MFFLPWWTYVLIATIVFTSAVVAVWLAGVAFEKSVSDDGPFPCGEHLGTDDDGAEDWCWQVAGHDGEHLGMRQDWSGVLLSSEWDGGPNEEIEPLPALPQRLSKVPVQGSGYTPAQLLGQTEHNDPWPVCCLDGCPRSKGHPGLCTG